MHKNSAYADGFRGCHDTQYCVLQKAGAVASAPPCLVKREPADENGRTGSGMLRLALFVAWLRMIEAAARL